MQIDDNLSIRIERVYSSIARVYIVDKENVQQPVPPHITMADSTGGRVPAEDDNFMIAWSDSYVLSINKQPFMKLNNQRQQVIMGPSDAASGLV